MELSRVDSPLTDAQASTYWRNRLFSSPESLSVRKSSLSFSVRISRCTFLAEETKAGETKHSGNKKAVGVSYYNSSFAYEAYNSRKKESHIRAFTCRLVILEASDGRKYLYDIVKIKENQQQEIEISNTGNNIAGKVSTPALVYESMVAQESDNVNKQKSPSTSSRNSPARRHLLIRSQPFSKTRILTQETSTST